ncbi:MAG TPA: ADP-glyceromanno-heptose 6-epimerase [Caulobacteraceae bacterium]|jgi:ADP-L-glycero-D-manno-heptose 6-epimerase|nr:ADP-glyceromanno-heptose 6-epimerase [Caulobacteraceae bacterium]
MTAGGLFLVTGGAGFIGSNVAAALAEDPEAEVVVCDTLGAADHGKWRNIAKRPLADLIAPDELFDWLSVNGGRVEAVVHMGAISSTTETDVDLIVEVNFRLSRDLFLWCEDARRRFVYASSAATYGDGALGFEDRQDIAWLDRLRPLNAYGWSKALFDRWAVRRAASGEGPPHWTGLKFFNVYGPNEGHKGEMKSVIAKIVPDIVRGAPVTLFKSGEPAYPDGGQMRDFVYVRDAAACVAWLARGGGASGVFNFGSGQARSFADLARAAFAAAGREPQIDYVDMPEALRGRYQYYTCATMDRLREAGWNAPPTSLESGVDDYVRRFLLTEDQYL